MRVNGGEESNLPCRKIPNNLCSYSAFKEVKYNPSLLEYGLHIVTFFQRN
jgi:hypothetical protein